MRAMLPRRMQDMLNELFATSPATAETVLKNLSRHGGTVVGCSSGAGGVGFAPPVPDLAEHFRWFKVWRSSDTAVVHIDGELISIGGRGTAEQFAAAIEATGCKTVQVHFNAPGGDSDLGAAVSEILSRYDTTAIITRAYSSGMIAMLGAKRIIARHDAKILVHSPCSWTLANSVGLRMRARHMKPIERRWAKILRKRTGQSAEVVKGWLVGDDHWFDATQARAAGFVDEILPATKAEMVDVSELPAGTDAPAPFEGDAELMALLEALPTFRVSDRAKFLREGYAAIFAKVQ